MPTQGTTRRQHLLTGLMLGCLIVVGGYATAAESTSDQPTGPWNTWSMDYFEAGGCWRPYQTAYHPQPWAYRHGRFCTESPLVTARDARNDGKAFHANGSLTTRDGRRISDSRQNTLVRSSRFRDALDTHQRPDPRRSDARAVSAERAGHPVTQTDLNQQQRIGSSSHGSRRGPGGPAAGPASNPEDRARPVSDYRQRR